VTGGSEVSLKREHSGGFFRSEHKEVQLDDQKGLHDINREEADNATEKSRFRDASSPRCSGNSSNWANAGRPSRRGQGGARGSILKDG